MRGEEHPANLLTNHFVGQDRIHSLPQLVGCEYRGGRSDAAPMMRKGVTASKGELLHLTSLVQRPVPWDGHCFEEALGTSDLPEAFRSREWRLPHVHRDLTERYPQAVACPEMGDADPAGNDTVETSGKLVGSQVQLYK